MANRNKSAGTKWELTIIKRIAKLFNLIPFNNKNHTEAEIGSTRVFSRIKDANKVDVYIKPGCKGDTLNIQAKSYAKRLNYDKILEEMPKDGMNIIAHQYTKKAKTRFVEQGKYAIMTWDTLEKLLEHYE